MLKEKKPVLTWLETNGKLNVVELPTLLTDFLLSASGEIQGSIPGDLQLYLKNFKDDKGDVLLSRKAEIYSEAIKEIIQSNISKPDTFYKSELPDTGTVWGEGQLNREVAITGIALAFIDLSVLERQLLAELRELFRSGKEGRGKGDLNPLMPISGFIGLSDDLLPRYGRRKELRDSDPIGRLKGYWRTEEKDKLVELANILPLDYFLKLHQDRNMNRLLEAMWKTARTDFDLTDSEATIEKLEKDFTPVLQDCLKLEQESRDSLALSGINFEGKEQLVKAKDGIRKIIEIAKESQKDAGVSALTRYIIKIFMNELATNNQKDIRELASSSSNVKRSVDGLKKASDDVKRNFLEYSRATRFVGIKEDQIKQIVAKQMKLTGTPTLEALETSAGERKGYLEDISKNLNLLDRKLGELEGIFRREA